MTKKKAKQQPQPLQENGSDSEEDGVEEFTKIFMSQSNAKASNNRSESSEEEDDEIKDEADSDDSDTSDQAVGESLGPENEEESESNEEEDIHDNDEENESEDENEESEDDIGEDDEIEQMDDRVSDDPETDSDDGQTEMESTKDAIDRLGDEEMDFAELRKQLSDMPFEELEKLKEKIGMKMYNQAMFGQSSTKTKQPDKPFKRENKNRPMEISSKKRPPRLMKVIEHKKKVTRDPRFDDLSGAYSETHFKKNYGFLSDMKQKEKQKLIKQHKKETDEDRKKQLEQLINNMNQEERREREKEKRSGQQSTIRKKERALVAEGKKPFFLKKSDQRKLELAEKYRELQKSGKVDKYLSKKRKKNASKDRKILPNRDT